MSRVLVVDDVPDNVKLMTCELADLGYEVDSALDGPTALRLARERSPDVILLDVMMPGMDGIEVCRRLKADPVSRTIPVVMVSARERENDVVEGLDAGAHDYVTKPFNTRILLARVRSAVRAKADHDTITELNRRLAEQATVDSLTGARNRAYLSDAMSQAMSLSRRRGLPLSLVMLDVDHFKSYNDTYGHPAGDDVLRAVVEVLSGVVRAHDVVARYGGEEFVVLLPATDTEGRPRRRRPPSLGPGALPLAATARHRQSRHRHVGARFDRPFDPGRPRRPRLVSRQAFRPRPRRPRVRRLRLAPLRPPPRGRHVRRERA